MLGYSYDDGGRSSSGWEGSAGDCSIRALAIYTGHLYDDVYDVVDDVMKVRYSESSEKGVYRDVWQDVYRMCGLSKVKMRWGTACPTYEEAYNDVGNCIVFMRGHLGAIVGGKLRDTFDHRLNRAGKPRKSLGTWHR